MSTFYYILWTHYVILICMEVIMGIDPGATSGYAALTATVNPKLLLCKHVVWPKPGSKKDLPANTPSAVVEREVEALSRLGHTVIGAAIEDQYLSVNPDSMKKLSRNGGRWEEAFRRLGIPVAWINTQTWQSAELGTCKIDSKEVKRRCANKVRGLWNIRVNQNAADACIIGRYEAVRAAYRIMRSGSK